MNYNAKNHGEASETDTVLVACECKKGISNSEPVVKQTGIIWKINYNPNNHGEASHPGEEYVNICTLNKPGSAFRVQRPCVPCVCYYQKASVPGRFLPPSSSNSMVCPAHSAAPCPSKVELVIWASSITGCFISGCPVFSYLPIYPVPSSRALETWRALKSLWWDWTDTPCLSNMACSLPLPHHTIAVIPTCCQSTAHIRKQYGDADVDV